jgi:hypothetical protein
LMFHGNLGSLANNRRCRRQRHRMHICLCFPFLSQVLTWRGLVTTVSWKMRGLSAKRARSICGVHLLAGAVKEDYGAGPNMGHVTYQVWGAWGVQNSPSPVYEPEAPPRGTDARTGGPALGPTDRSLLSSAYCGTDAMREDARNEDRGSVLVVASYYFGCRI